MEEARIRENETGKVVEGEGWFVLNMSEASWERNPDHGVWCRFEADDARFGQFGFNVHIVEPGQPSGRYHAETDQEGFLVLVGECVAIVEDRELRLNQWDYLHCPPGTEHIIVGAGDGPCAVLMTGARTPGRRAHYPVNGLAARHGASTERETDDPEVAYAGLVREQERIPSPWPLT